MKQILKMILESTDMKQSVDDTMFNATRLNNLWFSTKTNWNVEEYVGTNSTEEYVEFICETEGLFEENVIIYKEGNVLMHPMIFIDFAMWLSPKFKYDILNIYQNNTKNKIK
jgi:hypothetical protein